MKDIEIVAIKVLNYLDPNNFFAAKEEEKTFTRDEFIEAYSIELFDDIEDSFYDDTSIRDNWKNGIHYELIVKE